MISQRYLTTSPSEQLSSNTYTTLKTGALESRILSPEGLVESQRSPLLETGTMRSREYLGCELGAVSMKSGLRDRNNFARALSERICASSSQ